MDFSFTNSATIWIDVLGLVVFINIQNNG